MVLNFKRWLSQNAEPAPNPLEMLHYVTGVDQETLFMNFLSIDAKGHVDYDDFRRLIGYGIPLVKALSDNLDMAQCDIIMMAKRQGITILQLYDAINVLTTQGGLFYLNRKPRFAN